MPYGGQKHANEVRVWKLPPEEWMTEEKLALLRGWSREGYTLKEVANMMGLSTNGLQLWRKKYPEIDEALKVGLTEVNYMVESALLKRALGYKTEEVKVITTIRHGKTVEEVTERLTREEPPNVQAIQTWLYNKARDKWKNMNSSRNFLEDLDEDTTVSISIERPSKEGRGSEEVRRPVDEDAPDEEWMEKVNEKVKVRGLSEDEKKQRREQEKEAKRKKKEEDAERSESVKIKRKLRTMVDDSTFDGDCSEAEWDRMLEELGEQDA